MAGIFCIPLTSFPNVTKCQLGSVYYCHANLKTQFVPAWRLDDSVTPTRWVFLLFCWNTLQSVSSQVCWYLWQMENATHCTVIWSDKSPGLTSVSLQFQVRTSSHSKVIELSTDLPVGFLQEITTHTFLKVLCSNADDADTCNSLKFWLKNKAHEGGENGGKVRSWHADTHVSHRRSNSADHWILKYLRQLLLVFVSKYSNFNIVLSQHFLNYLFMSPNFNHLWLQTNLSFTEKENA